MAEPAASDNAAWVDIELPLAPEQALDCVRNIERFLRLNPHLEITRFERAADGRYRLEGLNEMNGLAVSCGLTLQDDGANGFRLDYDSGLKLATTVTAAAHAAGTLLTIREAYRQPENDADLAQVDRSLTPWGVAIRRHLLGLSRWGRLPGYRRWRERVWLGMRPRERRIVRLIAWVTALEFVVFLFVLSILVIESARG
ncbi:MAG: hypothetical protein HZC23_14270 [Rhodocyclales bacterium]|nr:hypothetical protein [Rhodocyclales bacterium]